MAAAGALFAVGCDVDPYCLDCGDAGDEADTGVTDLGRGDFEGQLLCIRPQDLQKVAEAMAQGGERIDDPEDDDR